MPTPNSPAGRTRRLAALSALLLTLVAAYAFVMAGRFLAREDQLRQADAILVLAGTLIERPLEAADLYHAGYARHIVISRDAQDQDVALVAERGVALPARSELVRQLLQQLGVPDGAVITPARIHDNTGQEAETLRALALERGWTRVLVVTSKYHLRRAGLACRRHLRGTGVDVIMRGSRYDRSIPERWWRQRHDIRWLASEMPKFALYAIGLGM